MAGFDSALSVGLVSGSDEAFGDEHLLAGVLAVPVVVGPVFPVGSFILGEVDGYVGYGYLQGFRLGCGSVRGAGCGWARSGLRR